MAEPNADAATKKPAFSSRIMQMKFMQRGKEKAVLKEAITEQVGITNKSSTAVGCI